VAEVLSQSEIDALLNALQSGEIDAESIKQEESEKKVRVYDFRRPNKFSKDQLNTIEVIIENYCRLLTTFLSGQLRARVQCKVASVEQLTYDEFVRSIPNPTILNIFGLKPFEGKAILEINPHIVFYIIDRLFGGPGTSNIKGRPLTEIEQNIVIKTVKKITEKDFEVEVSERRAGDPAVLIASSDKIQQELNWQPEYPELEKIISTAWQWHKSGGF